MALEVKSSYVGEALEQILVKATTGNELVERGLIKVVPNIVKDYYLPRMRVGKMLQKPKEQPDDKNSKGDFKYDERKLSPKEFMAFTTFNPRSFEHAWRKFQPTGELVYSELSEEGKALLLSELAKAVNFELGGHIINGEYAEGDDDTKLFDGILKRIKDGTETIKIAAPVAVTESNIQATMAKIRRAAPKAIRNHRNLRFLMSIEDWEKYDDALTALPNKGTDPTSTNAKRFKGIPIETLADMPEHVIVLTLASNDNSSNLWLGIGNIDDQTTIQVDKMTNAGERYFFKMKMKADTQIMWDDYAVFYDGRSAGA